MKQKFLYLSFLIVLSCMCSKVYAQTVEVLALEIISTAKPEKVTSVKLIDSLNIKNEQILSSGVILKGYLTDVKKPKRLKRDARFSFKPIEYIDLDGDTHSLKSHIIATYTKPINKNGVAKNVALGVGNLFVKGLSTSVAALEGAVKNKEGNRLKSSAVSVYESTPLSYTQKGQDLYIEEGQHFYIKFHNSKCHKNGDKQKNIQKENNYSYTIEKE